MFTFIAQKESSSDYCMGCHMASYSSDFKFENHLSEKQLIELWSDYLAKNEELDHKESGYYFIILKNGVQLYNTIDENGIAWDGHKKYEMNSDEYWDNHDQLELDREKAEKEIQVIFDAAENLADQKHAANVEAKRLVEQAKQQKEQAEAMERKKKQFEQLKAELGA